MVLSDSLRFSDFSVVLKNRPKESASPTQPPTPLASPTGAPEEGGKPEPTSGEPGPTTPAPGKPANNADEKPEVTPGEPEPTVAPAPDPSSTPASGGNTGIGQTDPSTQTMTRAEILAYCDSELESLWDYYTERVQEMEREARAEYHALPAEEQTKEKKEEIVTAKTDRLYALEDECDARVNRLLSDVAAELRKLGEDTSVISDYRKAYADRKHAMESDYIERFRKSVA